MSNGNVIANFTNSGGQLQIHFTSSNGTIVTSALINTITESIQYSNSSSSPPANVTLTCKFNDGVVASNVVVNDVVNIIYYPPSISNSVSTATLIAGLTPVNISTGIIISDLHELGSLNGGLGNYSGASLTIARSGSSNSQDVFSFGTMADVNVLNNSLIDHNQNIIANFTNSNGKLQINFVGSSGAAPTTVLVNEIANAIQYSNSSHIPPSSVTLSYKFSDGIGVNSVTTNATVKIVYYAPIINNSGSTVSIFTEGTAPVTITTGIVISDPYELGSLNGGLGDYNRSSLTVSRSGSANSLDVFSFGTMAGITLVNNTLVDANHNVIANITNSSGQLSINFTSNHGSIATTSIVNTVANAIQYSTSGYVPTGSINLAYTFNDGIGVNNVTTNAVVNVHYVPVISGLNAVNYTEGSAAMLLSGAISVVDQQLNAGGSANLSGSTLVVQRDSGGSSNDLFSFPVTSFGADNVVLSGNNLNVGSNTIASFTNNNGVLTITFTSNATTGLINEIARAIQYQNNGDHAGSITIDYQFTNYAENITSVLTPVTVNINYASPNIIGLSTVSYTEGDAAVAISSNVSVIDQALDVSGSNVSWAGSTLVVHRAGGGNSNDIFSLPGTPFGTDNIVLSGNNLNVTSGSIASINNVNGVLTITFTANATADLVNEIARAIQYQNNGDGTGSVVIDYQFTDYAGNVASSLTPVAVNINYATPSITGLSTIDYTEGSAFVALSSNVNIIDQALDASGSSVNLDGSTLVIHRAGGGNSNDVLSLAGAPFGVDNIVLSGNNLYVGTIVIASISNNNGVLTVSFTANATAALVNEVARAIQYQNNGDSVGSITIDYQFTDHAGNVASSLTPVVVNIEYATPVITGLSAVNCVENAEHAITIASGVNVIDQALGVSGSNVNLAGSTLIVQRAEVNSHNDIFSLPSTPFGSDDITLSTGNLYVGANEVASISNANGVLAITFTANATIAVVNEIAKAIQYRNSGDSIGSVTIDYQFTDHAGNVASSLTPLVVNITSYTPSTIVVNSTNATYIEGNSAVNIASNVTISQTILQSLNGGWGDYSGSTLIISRSAGADSQDAFSFGTMIHISVVNNTLVDLNQNVIANITKTPGQLQIDFVSGNGSVATTSVVHEIVNAIQYSTSGYYYPGAVNLEYVFNDGIVANNVTASNIVNVNYLPIISGLNEINYIEGSTAVAISNNITIDDQALNFSGNNSGLDGSTLVIHRAGGGNSHDIFSLPSTPFGTDNIVLSGNNLNLGANTIASINNANGVLTVTFTTHATAALVNEIARAIQYQNNGDNAGAITIDYQFADHAGNVTSNLTPVVVNINYATPSITGLSTVDYTEGSTAVASLSSSVNIVDQALDASGSNVSWNGSTLVIHRAGGGNSNDIFSLPSTPFGTDNIVLSGNNLNLGVNTIASITNANGVLTVTFTTHATAALVNEIANAILYQNNGDSAGAITLDYQFTDHAGNVASSLTPVTVNIVYDPPSIQSLDATSVNTYIVGSNAPIVIDNNITVSDTVNDAKNSGSGNYDNAQLTVSRHGGANADDVFNFASMPDVTVSGNTLIVHDNVNNIDNVIANFTDVNGQLQINFTSGHGAIVTTSLVNEVAQAIEYQNINLNQSNSIDLSYTFNDGNGIASYNSVVADTIININGSSLTATDLDVAASITPIIVDSNMTISSIVSDAHNNGVGDYNGSGLTIARTGGANSDDVFSFASMMDVSVVGNTLTTTSGSVIANFVNANGQLQINFTSNHGAIATTNLVDEVMQAVQYQNNNASPPASVNLSYTFNDSSNIVGDDWLNTLLINSKVVASSDNNNIVDAGPAPLNTVNQLTGNGEGDQFVFKPGYNHAIITNFDNTHDQIDLSAFGLSGINDPNLHISVIDGHTNITVAGGGISINLENDINQLHNNNFIF